MSARVAIGRLVQLPIGPVHLREDGPADGPVVVLLHGFASSMHAFDSVTARLAEDCRVVRVDLLGHGSSTRAAAYDSDTQAAMVADLLRREGIGPDTVVGHSFGADVAIALAEQPEQAGPEAAVSRVVVVGQAPDYRAARLPRGSWLLTRPQVGRWLQRLAPAPAINRAARFAFQPGARPSGLFDRPDRIALDYRATAHPTYRTVLVDRPRLLADRPLDVRLGDLGLPALVILGERDRLYPVAATRARYESVPGVRVEVLAESGHSAPLEQPGPTAELIRGFIGSGPRSGARQQPSREKRWPPTDGR